MEVSLGKAALELFGKLAPKPRRRHVGKGQERARVRHAAHASKQAARVAPALPALAEKRKAFARKRAVRWAQNNQLRLNDVPGHIRAKLAEKRA